MEKTISQLEFELEGKNAITTFLMKNYSKETDLERKARYAIIFRRHFEAIARLCDQLEDKIEEAITILETKKTA